jgi:hypothetical protein
MAFELRAHCAGAARLQRRAERERRLRWAPFPIRLAGIFLAGVAMIWLTLWLGGISVLMALLLSCAVGILARLEREQSERAVILHAIGMVLAEDYDKDRAFERPKAQ